MAGYSKRSLVDKLGIKPGAKVFLLNAPPNYDETLGTMPEGATTKNKLIGSFDFIHYFCFQRKNLEKKLPALKEHIEKNGMIWISWPKGSSKVPTDLNENLVREIALKNGLVDVKVCAVDHVWSGLKLIYRLKDR